MFFSTVDFFQLTHLPKIHSGSSLSCGVLATYYFMQCFIFKKHILNVCACVCVLVRFWIHIQIRHAVMCRKTGIKWFRRAGLAKLCEMRSQWYFFQTCGSGSQKLPYGHDYTHLWNVSHWMLLDCCWVF